jgi:membrane protein required for colicin V production
MNYIDIIIAVPLLYGLIKGFVNGLVKEVASLFALVLGVYVAINFSEFLEPKIEGFLGGYEEFVPVISFALLFLVSVVTIKLLGKLIDKLTKALALGIVSRFLGAVFGGIKVVVILGFLLIIVEEYSLLSKDSKKNSVLLQPLKSVSAIIDPEIKKHKSTIFETVEQSAEKAKEKLNKVVNPE